MIRIATDINGSRSYLIPRQLLDVAKRLFPDQDEAGAVFELACRLTADRFATVAHIAVQDMEIAAMRAAEWMGQQRLPASQYVIQGHSGPSLATLSR